MDTLFWQSDSLLVKAYNTCNPGCLKMMDQTIGWENVAVAAIICLTLIVIVWIVAREYRKLKLAEQQHHDTAECNKHARETEEIKRKLKAELWNTRLAYLKTLPKAGEDAYLKALEEYIAELSADGKGTKQD